MHCPSSVYEKANETPFKQRFAPRQDEKIEVRRAIQNLTDAIGHLVGTFVES